MTTQPRWGWGSWGGRDPGVGRRSSGQPWAGGRNPFGIANPIGVAAYALQSKLPGKLKGKLPTAKQLAGIVRAELEEGK